MEANRPITSKTLLACTVVNTNDRSTPIGWQSERFQNRGFRRHDLVRVVTEDRTQDRANESLLLIDRNLDHT